MKSFGGSKNNSAFSEKLLCQVNLPDESTITYLGAFNNSFFPVSLTNPDNDLLISSDIETATWINPLNELLENYVAILLKSKYDGIGRRVPVDLVFALDKSGSMKNKLGQSSLTCIELAKNAVLELITQLESDDSFGLITFNSKASTELSMRQVSLLKRSEYKPIIDKFTAHGGTSLSTGYYEALNNFISIKDDPRREKRIIFATDMQDLNSPDFEQMISEAANKRNINTTIIGVGVNVNTEFLERISRTKGFNYFCVMNETELIQVVVQDFKYNYFPIAHNISISFKSNEYELVSSFGTPPQTNPVINLYQRKTTMNIGQSQYSQSRLNKTSYGTKKYSKKKDVMPVLTRITEFLGSKNSSLIQVATSFASPYYDGHSQGGLILLKLAKKSKASEDPRTTLTLDYENTNGSKFRKDYSIQFSNINTPLPSYGRVESKLMSQALRVYLTTIFIKNLLTKKKEALKDPKFYKMIKYVLAFIKNNEYSDYQQKNKGEIEKITTLVSKLSL